MENKHKHDYTDTIRQAAQLDETTDREDGMRDIDAETALDALSLSAAMGTYAQDETVANFLELELAAELAQRAYSGTETGDNEKDDGYLD